MRHHLLSPLVLAAGGLLLLTACEDLSTPTAPAPEAPGPTFTASSASVQDNAVTDWMEHTLETVREERIPTPFAGRLYAMSTGAMFDAVNGIDRASGQGYTYAIVDPPGAPAGANRAAAVVAAAHTVLSAFADDHQSALDAARDSDLADLGDPAAVADGADWGDAVGDAVIADRADDGTQDADWVLACVPGPVPDDCVGKHRNDFNRAFADMDPFVIASKDPYVPHDPPELDSGRYASSHRDVRTKGTDDGHAGRDEIAFFFHTPGGTVRPTGLWFQGALALARQEGTVESLSETARLMALLGLATADAIIPIWEGKAVHHFWRPFHAIREAGDDGNRRTVQDENWMTRTGSLGGSGENPSGFASFSMVAAKVFEDFYGTADLELCFSSDNALNERCWTNVHEAGEEGGRSRVFQGVHFQFTVAHSRESGLGVAEEVLREALQPVDGG